MRQNYIISVVNNKGGVGKSTTAANLAHALSLADKSLRILAVDMDSQCNLTELMLGRDLVDASIYEVLSDESVPIESCIYPTKYEHVAAVPNTPDTASLEPELLMDPHQNYKLLRNRLRDYALANYDVTLIDCPPNLGFFVLNAMIASDSVLVPIECASRFAIKGLDKTIETIKQVRKTLNPDLRFLRLLINRTDRRTSIAKSMIEQVRKWHKGQVFEQVIAQATTVHQAEAALKTVIRHSPRSGVARAYKALAYEFLEVLAEQDKQLDIIESAEQRGELRANA